MDDFRAALDFMATQYPGAPLWAAGMSFGSWVALTVGAEDPRVSTLIGIAPPVTRYDFGAVERSRSRSSSFRASSTRSARSRTCASSTRGVPSRRSSSSSTRADHLFDGKVGEVADAIEDLLGDWESTSDGLRTMHEAVIVSAVRTAVGKAPGGTLRGTRPDELGAVAIAEALSARRASTPPRSTT